MDLSIEPRIKLPSYIGRSKIGSALACGSFILWIILMFSCIDATYTIQYNRFVFVLYLIPAMMLASNLTPIGKNPLFRKITSLSLGALAISLLTVYQYFNYLIGNARYLGGSNELFFKYVPLAIIVSMFWAIVLQFPFNNSWSKVTPFYDCNANREAPMRSSAASVENHLGLFADLSVDLEEQSNKGSSFSLSKISLKSSSKDKSEDELVATSDMFEVIESNEGDPWILGCRSLSIN